MKKQAKKQYTTPQLVIHGDLRKITKQGGQPNADLQQGPNGTAWSPA